MAIKKEQLYICFLNTLSAMGYSIVAPLFPPMFKEKGISNEICSYFISTLALVQIILSIYFPIIAEKFGRKKIFFISLILQALVTLYYGIMNYITNNFYFILNCFINRIIHGISCCNINIVCFTITSLINKGEDLEVASGYMEFSWMVGLSLGPVVISIFYSIGGYSLPYYVCTLLCLVGIYAFYQIPQVDENLYKESEIINNNSDSNSLFSLFKYPQILLLAGVLIIEDNSLAFFIPTLVNHLNETWNISTSVASLYFLSSTISYALVLQKIHELIVFFGNFPLIFLGLILTVFTCLIIAPISLLPHSHWTILTGITIQGINSCFIIVPSYVELNLFARYLFPDDLEKQNIIASSLFNLSFYSADFFSPIVGSYFTTRFNFEVSAYFTSILTGIFSVAFFLFYKEEILSFFDSKKKENFYEKNKQSNLIPLAVIDNNL